MDDKLRSEVMDDIEYLWKGEGYLSSGVARRFTRVMTDYEHLELQMLQAKRIIGALTGILDHGLVNGISDSDAVFACLSHAKEFLGENQ